MFISLKNISYHIARGLLFDNVDFNVAEGDRIAIIGRNGSGKSSLLNIIAGLTDSTSGERDVQKDARVLLVKQVMSDEELEKTPLDYLREADAQLQQMYAEAERLSSATSTAKQKQQAAALMDLAAALENERYDTEAPQILQGLGISIEQQDSPMNELSGGLSMRVSLASALIQQPDVLLLDEPTNHLDLPSVLWLKNFLQEYTRPFVMISHDRTLLNDLVTTVYHLQQGKLESYNGNFDTFLQVYQLQKEQAVSMNEKLDKNHKKTQAFIDAHKTDPKWRGNVRTRERLMEKDNANRAEIIKEEPVIPLEFAAGSELKDPILDLQRVAVGYEDKTVLSGVNLSIQTQSRIGILGCNGQGKSTLAKLITGHLEKASGQMISDRRLKIGYFSQNQTDVLDVEKSVSQQLASVIDNPQEDQIRSLLDTFGFDRNKIATKVADLSGGEKTRLLLAMIAIQRPNLILMDEPTNHLDFETREALIKAINDFDGAVVLISHDWDLLEKTMKDFWLVKDGKAAVYKGDLEKYKDMVSAPAAASAKSKANKASSSAPSVSKSGFMGSSSSRDVPSSSSCSSAKKGANKRK